MKRQGFTLVELSIVLVLIGLLIGGILAAQSMVGTAKIQSVVRQLSQYDIAVTNFQTKYNQLPGDSNLINPVGNNNGQIEQAELQYFWSDLSSGTGLKNSKGIDYVPSQPYNTGPTEVTCPKFNIDQNSAAQPCLYTSYFANFAGIVWSSVANPGNYYVYDETNAGIYNDQTATVLKPATALAIDQKIDDGQPGAGNVQSAGNDSNGVPCALNYTATTYAVSNTNYLCEMFFKFGTTNGTTN